MGGSRRFSRTEVQALLLIGSSQLHLNADFLDEDIDVEAIIDSVVTDDMLNEVPDETILELRRMGVDLALLSSFVLSSGGPRGCYDQILKCEEFFNKALAWPDREFRQEFRVSRPTFDFLVERLEQNPIFMSTGRKPQLPVRYQLGCFLMRYGTAGANSISAAHKMGLGTGTVYLYCRRVIRALREIGLQVLVWGDDQRHAESKQHFAENGFDNCIGIVDGSLIRLMEMPIIQGVLYLCRKKFAAINVQAIVDHQKRFISCESGWPGSVPDVTVWKQSHVWQHRHDYFEDGEYLLADKGYPSSPYLLRPFTEPEVLQVPGVEKERRREFNRNLSNKRIYVEHAFGMLKGRFPSLKLLATPRDISDIYRLIEALMVVHNLCIDIGDHPGEISDYDENDDVGHEGLDRRYDIDLPAYGGAEIGEEDANIPPDETDDALRVRGQQMRLNLLDQLFPM